MCSVERIELENAHCCAFCASVNGADSAVRFASVCSVNRVYVAAVSIEGLNSLLHHSSIFSSTDAISMLCLSQYGAAPTILALVNRQLLPLKSLEVLPALQVQRHF